MSSRDRGLSTLRIWYNASGLAVAGVTFDQAVAYYDGRSPSFLAALGDSAGFTTAGKVDTAMKGLASAGWQRLPDRGAFFDALAGETLKFRFEDVKAVASQTVADIKTTAVAGLGVYLGVLAVGALILLASSTRKAGAS